MGIESFLTNVGIGPFSIIMRVHRSSYFAPYRLVHIVNVEHAIWNGHKLTLSRATGKGFTVTTALYGAIGEAIERYCASAHAPYQSTVFASQEELPNATSAAEWMPLDINLEVRQRGYRTFTNKTRTRWVLGRDLLTDDSVHIPAGAVFYPYYPAEGEPRLFPTVTTGLACGETEDQAIYNALLEIIERDAFMLFWLSKTFSPHVDRRYHEALEPLINEIREDHGDLQLIDVTSDLEVPCVVAAIVRRELNPAIAVGLGAALNMMDATRSALLEAVQIRLGVLRHPVDYQFSPSRSSKFNSIRSHALSYADPKNLHFAEHITHTEGSSIEYPVIEDAKLQTVLSSLRRLGHSVYVVNLTTSDVRQSGLTVVRVLVPSLTPLFIQGFNFNASLRYNSVARSKGWDIPSEQQRLVAHPFS